jgi:nucleoid DNA-binding protein
MVILSACPTHQPAGAAWYRWFTQSVSSDTSMTLSASRVYDSFQRVIDSQLNRWLLNAGGAWCSARWRLHPCGGVGYPPHLSRWFASATDHTPAYFRGVWWCCSCEQRQPVMRRLTKAKRQVQERKMIHREVIAEVARRLPHRTQRDVAEVVEVLTEVWMKELMEGRSIIVPDIGRLSIEVQDMKAGGTLNRYGRLRRIYGRFRPTEALKETIQEVDLEQA